MKNKHNKITITTTYRELQILDTLVSKLKPDNTLLGRIEHNFNSNKSFISTNTFYEVGSGEEVKQQFSYLQVPAGQGVYQWVDFNHDGIPELNEFVVAVYKDQADYIRVYTPTDLSVPVFTNQFSEAISIRPATIWANKKGIRKKIALFSNQTTYRIDKKTGDNNLDHAYNPFYNSNADTSLKSMNASFRNSLLFNQLNPVFGMEFNYIQIGTRTLNTDGLDTRTTLTREIKIRWNFLRTINLNLILTNGERYNNSQFFTENDFDVAINSVESKLSYQPSTKFRLTGTLKFAEKQNLPSLGGEQSFQQTYGIDMKYSVLKKGNFTAKFNFIIMTYPYDPSTPTAYDMLEALQPGQNATWGVMYQKSLSNNMTISLNYDGRKSQGVKMINTGGAQVRANF